MSETLTTQQVKLPVSLTPDAVAEFKRLMLENNVSDENGVRIGVKGGGCAGFSYILGFDKKTYQDEEYNIGGLRVFMNKAHSIYLYGIEIEYQNGLNARGFVFNNPNAEKTCGCGTSFSA
jgi:iron-sulfur cluster assembly protein